jgi:plasmid stability protein
MRQLLVSKHDQDVVEALQRMAAAHGRSVEAEHLAILRSHLLTPPDAHSFKQALADMPYFDDDDLFERR